MKPSTHCSILAAYASLAVAAPAAADIHIDPHGNGGRTPAVHPARASVVAKAATFGGRSRQDQPVVATVPKRRRTITVNAAYVGHCGTGNSLGSLQVTRVKIGKKGRFARAKSSRTQFDDGYAVVESYKLAGRLTKSGASGTFTIHDVWSNPQGQLDDTCDSGTVGYRVLDSGVFAGTMSDGSPVVLEASPGMDRINSLLIPWTAQCKSGTWIWDTADISGPITSTGAFAGTLSPALDWGDGRVAHETQVLGGSVAPKLVVGAWRVQTSVLDATQAEVDTCDTGPLVFRLN